MKLLLVTGILAFLRNAWLLMVTVCDCNDANHLGILDLSEKSCTTGTRIPDKVHVSYVVYTSIPEQQLLKAYLCKVWIRRLTIRTFFGTTDTVEYTLPVTVQPFEC